MSVKQELLHSISKILKSNNDGSFATQNDRKNILEKFAKDLVRLGYKLREIRGLRRKHVEAVVQHWQDKNISIGTIKNRTTVIRFLCEKIKKPQIIPSNEKLKLGRRVYVPQTNRAIHNPDFSKISNAHIKISLELQRVFGLRREESLKIRPWQADLKSHLSLQPSWCKGGRGREIPILTVEQRYWLDEAKKIAKHQNASLIPNKKSYIKHRYVYDKQVRRAGLQNLHGLRHAYAQRRYKELTGWEPPLNGGPTSKQLTPQQKQLDYQARMILTDELGHSREQIVTNYCGR